MILPSPVAYEVYRGGVPRVPAGRSYVYLLAGNGVFKLAENHNLHALIPIAACHIAGLSDLTPWVRFVENGTWRLPGMLLRAMLDDARRAAWDAPREALYHVKVKGRQAVVLRPPQTGSAARLEYHAGDAGVVLDLHSHCEMGAFFSPTDDRDQKGFRLHAVIGRIFTRPELVLRVAVHGDYWTVPVGMIFDGGMPFFRMGGS